MPKPLKFDADVAWNIQLTGPAEALKIKGGNVLKTQNLGGAMYCSWPFLYDFEEKHANFPKNWGAIFPPAP